jgi:hypothetical protein
MRMRAQKRLFSTSRSRRRRRRRAKLLIFNSIRSIMVALSTGFYASCVRLKLEKQYRSKMRQRRNSKKHRSRSGVRTLDCSIKLSLRKSVWRSSSSRK